MRNLLLLGQPALSVNENQSDRQTACRDHARNNNNSMSSSRTANCVTRNPLCCAALWCGVLQPHQARLLLKYSHVMWYSSQEQ
jgi:hypothetical protein